MDITAGSVVVEFSAVLEGLQTGLAEAQKSIDQFVTKNKDLKLDIQTSGNLNNLLTEINSSVQEIIGLFKDFQGTLEGISDKISEFIEVIIRDIDLLATTVQERVTSLATNVFEKTLSRSVLISAIAIGIGTDTLGAFIREIEAGRGIVTALASELSEIADLIQNVLSKSGEIFNQKILKIIDAFNELKKVGYSSFGAFARLFYEFGKGSLTIGGMGFLLGEAYFALKSLWRGVTESITPVQRLFRVFDFLDRVLTTAKPKLASWLIGLGGLGLSIIAPFGQFQLILISVNHLIGNLFQQFQVNHLKLLEFFGSARASMTLILMDLRNLLRSILPEASRVFQLIGAEANRASNQMFLFNKSTKEGALFKKARIPITAQFAEFRDTLINAVNIALPTLQRLTMIMQHFFVIVSEVLGRGDQAKALISEVDTRVGNSVKSISLAEKASQSWLEKLTPKRSLLAWFEKLGLGILKIGMLIPKAGWNFFKVGGKQQEIIPVAGVEKSKKVIDETVKKVSSISPLFATTEGSLAKIISMLETGRQDILDISKTTKELSTNAGVLVGKMGTGIESLNKSTKMLSSVKIGGGTSEAFNSMQKLSPVIGELNTNLKALNASFSGLVKIEALQKGLEAHKEFKNIYDNTNPLVISLKRLYGGFLSILKAESSLGDGTDKLRKQIGPDLKKEFDKVLHGSESIKEVFGQVAKSTSPIGTKVALLIEELSKFDKKMGSLGRGKNVDFFKDLILKMGSGKDEILSLFKSLGINIDKIFSDTGKRVPLKFAREFVAGFGKNGAKNMETAIDGALKILREYLPSSPAKRGPLRDLAKSGVAFGNELKKGLNLAIPIVGTAAGKIAAKIRGFFHGSDPKEGALRDLKTAGKLASIALSVGMLAGLPQITTVVTFIATTIYLGIKGIKLAKYVGGWFAGAYSRIKAVLDPIKNVIIGTFSAPFTVLNGLKNKIFSVQNALAAVFVRGVFAEFTKDTLEAEVSIGRLSQKLGIPTEILSALGRAAKVTGSDISQLSFALIQIQKNISDALVDRTGDAARELEKLGLNLDVIQSAANPTIEAFLQLSDVMTQSKAGGKDFNEALEKIGLSLHSDVINLLMLGREEIGNLSIEAVKLNAVVSAKSAETAIRIKRAMSTLEIAFDGIKIMIAEEILPVVERVFNRVTGFIEKNQVDIRVYIQVVSSIIQALFAFIAKQIKLIVIKPEAGLANITTMLKIMLGLIFDFIWSARGLILPALGLIWDTILLLASTQVGKMFVSIGEAVTRFFVFLWYETKHFFITFIPGIIKSAFVTLKTLVYMEITIILAAIQEIFLAAPRELIPESWIKGITEAKSSMLDLANKTSKGIKSFTETFDDFTSAVAIDLANYNASLIESAKKGKQATATDEYQASLAALNSRLGTLKTAFKDFGAGAAQSFATAKKKFIEVSEVIGAKDLVAQLKKATSKEEIARLTKEIQKDIETKIKQVNDGIRKGAEQAKSILSNKLKAIRDEFEKTFDEISKEINDSLIGAFDGLDDSFKLMLGGLSPSALNVDKLEEELKKVDEKFKGSFQQMDTTLLGLSEKALADKTKGKDTSLLSKEIDNTMKLYNEMSVKVAEIKDNVQLKVFIEENSKAMGTVLEIENKLKTESQLHTEEIEKQKIAIDKMLVSLDKVNAPQETKQPLIDRIKKAKEEIGKVDQKTKEVIDGFVNKIGDGLTTVLNDFAQKGKVTFESLATFGEGLFQEGIAAGTDLIKGQLKGALTDVFSSFGAGGDFSNALFSGIAAVAGLLLSRLKSQSEVTLNAIESAVEETKQLRGVIAGETTLGIFEVGESLRNVNEPMIFELKEIRYVLEQIRDGKAGDSLASAYVSGR